MTSNIGRNHNARRKAVGFESNSTGDYSLSETSQILQSTDPSPEQSASLKDDVENIFEIINALPERQRKTILMHRVDELSYKEIAEKLSVSVSSIEKYMSSALKAIQRELNNNEASSCAGQGCNDNRREVIRL